MIDGLNPYPAMKNSGVPWLGKVPEQWQILPAMAVYRPRQVKNIGLVEKTVLSLSYGRIIVKPSEKLRGLVPGSFETYQIVDPGNIIVRTTDLQNDQRSLRIGHAHYRGIIAAAYLCLETKPVVSNDFGYQYLNAYDLLKIIYGFGSGLRQSLDFSDIKRMPVLVPPPDEQAAIVRFLHHADRRIRRFIRAKQKLIKLLEEEKQAIIHRAVTRGLNPGVRLKHSGVEWLGDVPEHWEVWQIGHFAAVGNGSTPSRGNASYWSDGTYPWLNSSSVHAGTISSSDQFVTDTALGECHLPRVRPGSVLVAITGQGKTRGTAAVLAFEATINQHIAFISLRRQNETASPEFLQMFLAGAYSELRRMSDNSGSTKGALTCEDLRHFRVLLPPTDEQREIVQWTQRATANVELALRVANREISLLHEYRTRLIADVVAGKLDVREAAARLPDEVEEPEPLDDIEAEGGEAGADDSAEVPEEAEA